jgi:hypothetical protein
MKIHRPVAALCALALVPALALGANDVTGLRAELQALKSEYQARVDALEARIQQLETAPAAQVAQADVPAAPTGGAGAAAFNPAVSLILGGSFTRSARDPADWNIKGFAPNGGEIGPGERSFNLGESELTLSASIDPYFTGQMTAAITAEDEIEVEEAFVRTTALPEGFTAKLGRFFSGFGYLNEVHAHAWDFVDQPLAYQALFGGQLRQNGVQVKWLAPTELFLEFGAETGNGEGYPATRKSGNGLNGATLFAHAGGDLGAYSSWRIGGAYLTQKAEERAGGLTDPSGALLFETFSGDARTVVVDAVFKWAPSARRELKLQGEYLRRRESGAIADGDGLLLADDYRQSGAGWYLQGVYRFTPRWRVGARYDSLDAGTPRYAFAPEGLSDASPERLSMMLDWNPSEFSRLRAQYDWDNARDDGSGVFDGDRILRLQYLYGIGAHGAHKY